MSQDSLVPLWAVELRETVARIDERTNQIPTVITQLDELRRTSVPHGEHEQLMERVEQLWNRDLGGHQEWLEMQERVPTLWEERSQRQGAMAAHRVWLLLLSAVVAVLTVISLLQNLGITIGVHQRT